MELHPESADNESVKFSNFHLPLLLRTFFSRAFTYTKNFLRAIKCRKIFSRSFFTFCTAVCLCFFCTPDANAYMVKYKEDFYRLFHVHHQQLPDDCIENIYWLEKAVQADFANPQYADAKITNKKEWEKYRYIYMMHLNLKLIEQHLRLGRIYDKKVAYFYDAPWKEEYLRDLEKAKTCYQAGLTYWEEAKLWAEKASTANFNFLFLTDLANWEDERERITSGKLNYEKILNRELTRLEGVISDFIAMDDKTY